MCDRFNLWFMANPLSRLHFGAPLGPTSMCMSQMRPSIAENNVFVSIDLCCYFQVPIRNWAILATKDYFLFMLLDQLELLNLSTVTSCVEPQHCHPS